MAVLNRMASVQVLPLGNYPNQSRTLPNASGIEVASDVTSIDFSIARCTTATPAIWPNVSTTLAITPEVSLDGGATWIEAGKSTSQGGISTFKGAEVAATIGGGWIPPQIGAVARRYRVTVVIAGGPLRSSATIEVN